MNGNMKFLMAGITIIVLVAGFVVGSMQSQLSNAEKFVPKAQYERDIGEIKDMLAELREFHMEARRTRP